MSLITKMLVYGEWQGRQVNEARSGADLARGRQEETQVQIVPEIGRRAAEDDRGLCGLEVDSRLRTSIQRMPHAAGSLKDRRAKARAGSRIF